MHQNESGIAQPEPRGEDGTQDGALGQCKNSGDIKSVSKLQRAARDREPEATEIQEQDLSQSSASPLYSTPSYPDRAWQIRPDAEVLYENFDSDKFFPRTSQPITAPPSAPTVVRGVVPSSGKNDPKSIRIVAGELYRKMKLMFKPSFGNNSNTENPNNSKIVTFAKENKALDTPELAAQTISTTPPNSPVTTFRWVRGELIAGSSIRVYHAMNSTTGEIMAVKQVERPKTTSVGNDGRKQMAAIEAMKSEGAILATLDHPHVIQYLGFEETPDFLNIFLEYVPGGSIGDCLRRHGKFWPLWESTIKSFTRQITEGLSYLHEVGIIHRVSPPPISLPSVSFFFDGSIISRT